MGRIEGSLYLYNSFVAFIRSLIFAKKFNLMEGIRNLCPPLNPAMAASDDQVLAAWRGGRSLRCGPRGRGRPRRRRWSSWSQFGSRSKNEVTDWSRRIWRKEKLMVVSELLLTLLVYPNLWLQSNFVCLNVCVQNMQCLISDLFISVLLR